MGDNTIKAASDFLKSIAKAAQALAGALEVLAAAEQTTASNQTPTTEKKTAWMQSTIKSLIQAPIAKTESTQLTLQAEYIKRGSEKTCHGVENVIKALEMSCAEGIIVNENIDMYRVELKNSTNGLTKVVYYPKDQATIVLSKYLNMYDTIVSNTPLITWLKEGIEKGTFGTTEFQFISESVADGVDIGALLPWKIGFASDDLLEGAPKSGLAEDAEQYIPQEKKSCSSNTEFLEEIIERNVTISSVKTSTDRLEHPQ